MELFKMPATPFFSSEEDQEHYLKFGYVILRGLDTAAIERLRWKTLDFLEQIRSKLPNRYFPVGQLMDFEARDLSAAIIKEELLPQIEKFFRAGTSIYPGTHLIKPFGRHSFLQAHQDSSLVDETKYHSVLIWCPLHPMNFLSGGLCVYPGSHLFGNIHRSTNVPWVFQKHLRFIYRNSKRVIVKPGEVCCFHTSLIHHSGHNFFSKFRLAVSALACSEGAGIINCFHDADVPDEEVDIYTSDIDFFRKRDFNMRPTVPYQLLERTKRRLPALSVDELLEMHRKIRGLLEN
ncbi:MAG: phytanoyl-CoA dioxygenase family protein [Chitinophagales bacterium]